MNWRLRPAPAAPVEHEAPSHRRVGSSEITVGRKSARFDHLTGRVHLAARNPGAPAVRPRTAPPAEQAHAPPRAAAMSAPSHRAIRKAVPRQFAEIARHSPCSRANASRGYENRPAEIPLHNQYDACSSRAGGDRGCPIEQRGATGASLGGLQAQRNTRATRPRRGSDRCRKNPASLRQRHAAPALRSATATAASTSLAPPALGSARA
jgi:hypothetical protein